MASSESDLNACISLLQRQIESLVQNLDFKSDARENFKLMSAHKSTEFKLLSSVQKLLLFLACSKADKPRQERVSAVKNILREFETHLNQIDTEALSKLTKTTQLQYLLEFTLYIDTIHHYHILDEQAETIIAIQPNAACRNAIRFLIKPDDEENPFARLINTLKNDAADKEQLDDVSPQLVDFDKHPLPIFIKKTLAFQLMNEVFNHLKHSPQSSILPAITTFLVHQRYELISNLSNLFNLYAKAVYEIQAFYNTVCSHPNENIIIDKEALSLARNFLRHYADSSQEERRNTSSHVMRVELLYKSALFLVNQHQINKTWHQPPLLGRQTLELTHLVFQQSFPGFGEVRQHFLKCIPHLLPAFLSFGMVDAFHDMANQAMQLFRGEAGIDAVIKGYELVSLCAYGKHPRRAKFSEKTNLLELVSQQQITLEPVTEVAGSFVEKCHNYCHNLFLLALINAYNQGTGKLVLLMYQQTIQANQDLKKHASTFFNALNSIIELFSLIEFVNSLQASTTVEEEAFALANIEKILNKEKKPQPKQYSPFAQASLESLFIHLEKRLTQHAEILDKPSTISMRRHRALIQYSTHVTKHLLLLSPSKQKSITKRFNLLFKSQQYNKLALALFDDATKTSGSVTKRAQQPPKRHQPTTKGKTKRKTKRQQLLSREREEKQKRLELAKKLLELKQQTQRDKARLLPSKLYQDDKAHTSSTTISTIAMSASESKPIPATIAATTAEEKPTHRQQRQRERNRLRRQKQRERQSQLKQLREQTATSHAETSHAETSHAATSQKLVSQAGLFKQSPKQKIAAKLMPQALIMIATEIHKLANLPIFLTGGAVEELWLGNKKINDYDCIMPDSIALAELSFCIEQIKKQSKSAAIQNLTYYIAGPEGAQTLTINIDSEYPISIDISLFHYDNINPEKSLSDNAMRRDIRSSAMYIDLTKADYSIIDPVKGLATLQQKSIEIHHHNPHLFEEDPLRLLRIAKAMLKHPDFEPGPHLLEHLQRLNHYTIWQNHIKNSPSLLPLHKKLMHMLERFRSISAMITVLYKIGIFRHLFCLEDEQYAIVIDNINLAFATRSGGSKEKQQEIFYRNLAHSYFDQQQQHGISIDLTTWPLYRLIEQIYPDKLKEFATIAEYYSQEEKAPALTI